MAKYTSDANLIRGAGKAYRNLDNAPGMYAGLDKIGQAGIEMMDTVVKKAEEAKAKKAAQDKAWYDMSGSVYENAGGFMKDVEYKDTAAQLTALKPRLIAAQESGNPEDIAAVMTEFNNIKSSVDDHKAFRETITDPQYGLSKAMDNSGVDGGNNGEDKDFMTKLIAEDYTISKNKDGDKVYTIDGVSKTMKEIKDMAILKDNIPYAAYAEASTKYSKLKEFNRDNVAYYIRNNIVPQEVGKLRAFLADDGFGNGKNFKALLNDSKNKASIKKEINNTIFNTDGGGISGDEYDNFVEAIVDPRHKFWENNGGEAAWQKSSSRIATEQLTNGIENRWSAIDRERNKEANKARETTGLNLSYGFRTWGQMKNEYDLIGSGKEGDRISVSQGDVKTVLVRDKEGNWVNNIGDATQVFTPNQVKQMKELNHLDDFEEAEITDPTMEAPIGDSGFKYKDYKKIDGEWFFTKDGKSEKVMSSTTKDQLNQIYVPK